MTLGQFARLLSYHRSKPPTLEQLGAWSRWMTRNYRYGGQ